MAHLLLKTQPMNNDDLKPNMDFDIQSLNKEAVEIYYKKLKENGKRTRSNDQEAKEAT